MVMVTVCHYVSTEAKMTELYQHRGGAGRGEGRETMVGVYFVRK